MEQDKIDVASDITVKKISDTEVEISTVIPEQVIPEKVKNERFTLEAIDANIDKCQANIEYYSSEKTKNEGEIAQNELEIAKIQSSIDEAQIELDKLIKLREVTKNTLENNK